MRHLDRTLARNAAGACGVHGDALLVACSLCGVKFCIRCLAGSRFCPDCAEAASQAGAEFGPEVDVEEAEDVARLDGLADLDEADDADRSGRHA